MDEIKPPRVRRVFVDSGPAGTDDEGDRVMVYRAEGTSLPLEVRTIQGHTTTTMTGSLGFQMLRTRPPRPGEPNHMAGFEGSDLIATWYALDQLGQFDGVAEVEITGDGQAIEMLRGKGRVSARWGGKNWAPDIQARIREAEKQYRAVRYYVIPSRENPAGADAKIVRFENLKRRSGKGFRRPR